MRKIEAKDLGAKKCLKVQCRVFGMYDVGRVIMSLSNICT